MDSKELIRYLNIKGYSVVALVIIAIILSVISIGGVGVYSHYEIKKRMREYDPDSIV